MMNGAGHLKACLDFPSEVTIETTGRCNARCVFCPHSGLKRKNMYMSDGTFLRVVDQLKEIPQTWRFAISPFKVNEMLMDKQIFERIAIINKELPNACIRLFTNLHSASDTDIEKLCCIENIADIYISLNSLNKEEYETLMGLDLDRTLSVIHRFLSYFRENGIRMLAGSIIISRVAQNPDSDTEYMRAAYEEFADYLGFVRPMVYPRDNWIDFVPLESPGDLDEPCGRWSEINICCDGAVAFCCRDARAAYPLGNITENTVLEIYNQPAYRRLREEMPNKRQLIPCRYCGEVSDLGGYFDKLGVDDGVIH